MYYIVERQEKVGPLSIEELKGYSLEVETQIWRKGLSNWVQVKDLPEVMSALKLKVERKSPSVNNWMIANIFIQLFVTWGMHFRMVESSYSDTAFYVIMMLILLGAIVLNIVSILVFLERRCRLARTLSIISCIVFIPIGIIGIFGMNKAIDKIA